MDFDREQDGHDNLVFEIGPDGRRRWRFPAYRPPRPTPIRDKQATLNTMPHYTDQRFKTAQTVYGAEERGLHYDYSDRLWEWNYDKAEAANKVAQEQGHPIRSCAYYEAYLTAYFGKPTEIKHILAGWNVATGYPYAVFGYRFMEGEGEALAEALG